MKLHFKSPGEGPGAYPIATRGNELKYLSFSIVQLGGKFREHEFRSGEEELSLDFYTGPVQVDVESASGRWSAQVPSRRSIAEATTMIYVPPDSNVKLTALDGEARVTVGGALGKAGGTPGVFGGVSKSVGKDNWTRTVFTHIADNVAAATHGETRREVLSSGEGSRPFQRFALAQSPLAYVPAANAAGSATSTITLAVSRSALGLRSKVPCEGIWKYSCKPRINLERE